MPSFIPSDMLEKFTTFGDLLRFLRRRAGITQIELSIAVGYSDAQISRLEQNLRLPDIPTIQARFVHALDLEAEPKAVARLLELAANVRREDAPGLGLCPYKGLNYFEEDDADIFVGREAATEKLVQRILSMASGSVADESRFLAVVGASGSGKSSLLRAGLLPALRWNKSSSDWNIRILTPGAHPLESLAASLTEGSESVFETATLMDDLGRDPRSLQIYTKRRLESKSNDRMLIAIDQFEELFTLCRSEQEKTAFIGNLLTGSTETGGPIVVIITMRADFYAHCADHIQLREALAQHQEYIGAMNPDELRRAIEEPASRGRWEFEPGLVDLLLHDIGREPGALPLLSHALLETWQRRRGRMMTLSGYTSSGGVRGAIAETAEAVFSDQFTGPQREIARRIFLRLTELGDETSTGDTRRKAKLDELILKPDEAEITQSVLKILADSRLVTVDKDEVEVSHEALIREWPTLRGWLEDNREGLRLHRNLTDTAQEWGAQNREADLLYRGVRLSQAQEWINSHPNEINQLEREFLSASLEIRDKEVQEREAQRQRELEAAQKLAHSEKQRAEEQARNSRQLSLRARYLAAAFVLALGMALTALFFGSQARQTAITAQLERRVANARELAAAALNNLAVDPERSILLSLQSISTTQSADGTVIPESVEALHRSLLASPIRMTLSGHGRRVLGAAFSPDGGHLATIGDDGTAIIWDSTTGEELLRLPGMTKPGDLITALRISYSPDGKFLAVCDRNLIKIHDPDSGELMVTLEGHVSDVLALTFSHDGNLIASGDLDGEVRIWDPTSGTTLHTLAQHSDYIEGLTFSPNGKWLATSGNDASIKIWDVSDGDLVQDYPGFPALVDSVAFSPDGNRLVFSDGSIHMWQLNFSTDDERTTLSQQELFSIPDGASARFSPDGKWLAAVNGSVNIQLWDAETGREHLALVGHTNWVMDIKFSPDGERLASTSLDGTVRLWDITAGREEVTTSSPIAGFGTRVAYNPAGGDFATNGGDGTATLWDATTGEPRLTMAGHSQEVMAVAFSPDGSRFATGGFDALAIVWDTVSSRKLVTLSGHEIGVRDIAFSPDGKTIATGGFDGTARLWDPESGRELRQFIGHEGLVVGVGFSPDGTRLATSSTDKTVKIWDLKSGGLVFTFTGHDDVVPDIAFSPDSRFIASGSQDSIVKIWDAATGSELLTITGGNGEIQAVAFSPDGKFLATGSGDNTAVIWDAVSGEAILSLPGSGGGVTGVAFSPLDEGAHLLVSSRDGVTRTFLLRLEDLLPLAHSRVTRPLTIEECRKYLHMESCPELAP